MQSNKTVIISCAGIGKRLGMGIVKALVDIDGKPLIIRNLELLDECDDIRIVVGYQAEKVIEVVNKYRKDITFVFNHDYLNTGTGASVSLAAKKANEYILTIDGDLLVHPEDMKKILSMDEEFIGGCKPSTDEPVLMQIENGHVTKFSRESGEFEWTGVCLIKSNRLKYGDRHVYQLLEPILPIKHLFLRTKEVDTINDYENAVKWIKNNYSDEKVIGIVGGMGSYATLDFFRRLIDAFPAEKEWERPRIIIDNKCNMPSRVRAILYNERKNELVDSLSKSIQMLTDNGATHIVLACNTSHVFLNDVYEKVPSCQYKVINIIEACAKKMKEDGISEAYLIASEGTILSKIYQEIFEQYNINIINPTKSEFTNIREFIEAVKQNNISEEIKSKFINYINDININSLILGCTELPIVYEKCIDEVKKMDKKIYDPLQCVIELLK